MPNLLRDLKINRVDLVDEGANSAAFVELYKRKETDTMEFEDIVKGLKPEHQTVVTAHIEKMKTDNTAAVEKAKTDSAAELEKAKTDLTASNDALKIAKEALQAANEQLDVLKEATKDQCACGGEEDLDKGLCKACGKPKMQPKKAKDDTLPFDQTETFKALPEEAKTILRKAREGEEAAKAELAKINSERLEKEAGEKATLLKALPVDKSKLVSIVKSASPEVFEVLKSAAQLIEKGGLAPLGKDGDPATTGDAFEQINTEAHALAKSKGISFAAAFTQIIKEKPELYKEYRKQEEEGGK